MKILTDDIEHDPTYEFEQYANVIRSMLIDSNPKFTMGVYGEWGSGKTTLMELIHTKLKQHSQTEGVATAWFNAWRYEHESRSATFPLILTILYALNEKAAEQIASANAIENKIKLKKIVDAAISFVRSWSIEISIPIPWTGGDMTLSRNSGTDDGYTSQDTIEKPPLQTGIELVEKLIVEINSSLSNGLKLVVFIDDLDRCSPQSALKVLESIKVLLNLNGIVYIMGVSHNTVANLITKEYESDAIFGEHYLRKIIQVPIPIPPWNEEDIKKLIDSIVTRYLDENYSILISTFRDNIARAVEPNPRELKRFINSFIIALEILPPATRDTLDKSAVLIFEILKARWNKFYLSIFKHTELLNKTIGYASLANDKATEILKFLQGKDEMSTSDKKSRGAPLGEWANMPKYAVEPFKTINENDELRTLLRESEEVLIHIDNLDIYRKVSEKVTELSDKEPYETNVEHRTHPKTPSKR